MAGASTAEAFTEAVFMAAGTNSHRGVRMNYLDRGATAFVRQRISSLACLAFCLLSICGTIIAQPPAKASPEEPSEKSFSSPENAAAALYAAARRNDDAELIQILGPDAREIIAFADDANERKARREHFAQKFDQMHRLVKEPDQTVALYVGSENWPFPVPLVEYDGAWYFDSELGKQEVLYRRIGRNEVEALEVCHALVDAESEYYGGAHHYTAKFISSEGSQDGLYWKGGAKTSPIGPHLANAGVGESNSGGAPFHGYHYRIILLDGGQGKQPGFAVMAFPAEYRSSGVMTFLMDQDGNAYEKDLGSATSVAYKQLSASRPDDSWKKVE